MTDSTSGFVPRWARGQNAEALWDEIPHAGVEPPLVPKLSTRLLPFNETHQISAKTLTDVLSITQRLLQSISYEVVYGKSSDVIDLRSADDKVLSLAKLDIEPFEQGSFVIPGRLSENEIRISGRLFSSVDVLDRLSEVFVAVEQGSDDIPASLKILQCLEELGKVTRREALIEYSPQYFSHLRGNRISHTVVNEEFINRVATARQIRVNPSQSYEELVGDLVALDLVKSELRIQMDDHQVVRATFGDFARVVLIESFNKRVKLTGTMDRVGKQLKHFHAFQAESLG